MGFLGKLLSGAGKVATKVGRHIGKIGTVYNTVTGQSKWDPQEQREQLEFENQVDPGGTLSETERATRVQEARRARWAAEAAELNKAAIAAAEEHARVGRWLARLKAERDATAVAKAYNATLPTGAKRMIVAQSGDPIVYVATLDYDPDELAKAERQPRARSKGWKAMIGVITIGAVTYIGYQGLRSRDETAPRSEVRSAEALPCYGFDSGEGQWSVRSWSYYPPCTDAEGEAGNSGASDPPGEVVTATPGAPEAGGETSSPAPNPTTTSPPTSPPTNTPPTTAPVKAVATVVSRYACYTPDDQGHIYIVFHTAAAPGSSASMTMTSNVAPTTRTAQATVDGTGNVEFTLDISEDGEHLQVTQLVIGGVHYTHNFGTYTPPPLGPC